MSAANFNTTMNGTQALNCSSLGNLTTERIGKTFAYSTILVVSLAGNTMIGIIVYKTKTMRKTINYFIVNMAMSDMLLPIFIFPYRIKELMNFESLFGDYDPLWQVFCKVNPFISFLSAIVSTESLLLIALDRFGAVVFPLRRPLISSKLCPFLILATWIFAAILSFPFLFAYKLIEYEGKWTCMMRLDSYMGEAYLGALPLVLYFVSFAVMIVLYFMIVFKLKSQRLPGEPSNNAEEERARRHTRVLQMTVAIVSGFVFCWTPINVFLFLWYFVWDSTTRLLCGVAQLWFSVIFVASANTAINPCICFTFSGYYRQGLNRLLRCQGPLVQR